ncbi:hypothetical protein R5R35_006430 [Gryllus longicercus]|uniref:Carboxylesterase type B domain-containing protein n=1 Tax=Gryllus longicercus TaxID=2509291 RepID=A0AAN9ZD00_9ORTH
MRAAWAALCLLAAAAGTARAQQSFPDGRYSPDGQYLGSQYTPDGQYRGNYNRERERDPYNRDPYNRDPYNRDPYNRDQYGRDQYGNYNPRDGQYPPGQGANTYFFGDRRYGYQQPGDDNYEYNRRGNDQDRFNQGNPNSPPLPGVLAGWRPDLQGRERPNSKLLPRDVSVRTAYGEVQGFRVYLYDDPDPRSGYRPGVSPVERETANVSVFLGIPYALPPTGDGRLRPPRPHRGWKVLQAVDFGPACPQHSRHTGATKRIRDMDEDCLYLNIYSPSTASGHARPYPVMFYIHGGDFTHGASNLFPGHVLAAFYEVVVVTINYRLGALGFLSTADDNSPGNYGLLDQALALQWVHENVRAFGGDPDAITLFGPDAGAASAGLLAVAPRTRHLVRRVIAQSGSALADWALIEDKYRAQNTSRVFGRAIGCDIDSAWKLVSCVRKARSFVELGDAEMDAHVPRVGLFPWAPVLDANFSVPLDSWYEGWREEDWRLLNDMPERLLRRRAFNPQLEYMSGVTMQEAAFMIYNNASLAPHYTVDQAFFDQKVRELVLRYNYTLNPEGVYQAIKYMYTYWPDPNNTFYIRERYIDLMSDFIYRAPSDHMAKVLAEQNVPLYLYVLNTTIEAFKLPLWRKVPHNIEHYYLTGAPFMDIEFFPRRPTLDRQMWTDNDRNMSHFFMKAYSDFARNGNPTMSQILGLYFEKATNGQLKYLNINTTYNSSVMLNFRQTESAFWTMYLPSVIGRLVPTYPPSTEFWWEPRAPLQIAFWSVSGACLLLIVVVVICCILWRNAKRQSDRYYSSDIMLRDEGSDPEGIENHSATNVYEYRDTPPTKVKRNLSQPQLQMQEIKDMKDSKDSKGRAISPPMTTASYDPRRSASVPSLRTSSASSLKDSASFVSSSPGGPRRTPTTNHRRGPKPQTLITEGGVPQTQV